MARSELSHEMLNVLKLSIAMHSLVFSIFQMSPLPPEIGREKCSHRLDADTTPPLFLVVLFDLFHYYDILINRYINNTFIEFLYHHLPHDMNDAF